MNKHNNGEDTINTTTNDEADERHGFFVEITIKRKRKFNIKLT